MPIHEKTADQMTNPAQPRRGSLAAMKDKLMGGGAQGGAHEPTSPRAKAHEPTADDTNAPQGGRRGSFARMQEKITGGPAANQDTASHGGAAPASPTGRRSSFAVMHDRLTFYQEAPKEPAKVNIREATADEMLNAQTGQAQGRRSSFARMGGMMGGGRK